MVAQDFFAQPAPDERTAAAPPGSSAPPPKKGFRGRLAAGVVAIALVGGAGSGALTATVLDHASTPAATSGRSSTTATSSTTGTTSAQSVYQQVSLSVVTITTTVAGRFGAQGQGTGSGVVLDTSGDILTNYHVVSGAQQIEVTLSDGTTASARVVGTNAANDLAVIRISVPGSKLHPATLGNSDNVQIGDTVYAIGSPYGLAGTLTEGIVSALHRGGSSVTSSGTIGSSLSNLIQTDTAINPGNSGGPLVNAAGQVIGINQSIESPVDGNVGVGFAIPINQVKQLLSSLEGGSNL